MTRPLIITDCDEVLLHMVSHFRDWLAADEGVDFHLVGNDFAHALHWQDNGQLVEQEDVWRLLNAFFDSQMDHQTPVPGAIDSIRELQRHADVVVLTNLKDFRKGARTRQLSALGLDLDVFTNQGPKGPALQAILDHYAPERAVFIDDLAQHHVSVAQTSPDTVRLHLCAEPLLAPHIDCAHVSGHAHARIDDWSRALPWLLEQLRADPTFRR